MSKDRNTARLEMELDQLRMVNELNEISLRELTSQLKTLQTTKAWKIMLLLRRFNEQFLQGPVQERKKFIAWLFRRLSGRVASPEGGSNRYDPMPSVIVHTIDEFQNTPDTTCALETAVALDSVPEEEINTPDTVHYQAGFDVFRFAVIEWDFRWQRPQQISSQFARHGNRVFYVSVSTIGLGDPDLSYNEVSRQTIIKPLAHNVWNVRLCSVKPLSAYQDIIDDEDLKYLEWSISTVRERFGSGETLSILDLPFWARLAFSMSNNTVIYDCMDDHAGFSTNSSTMLMSEEQLEQRADLVITSSAGLYTKVQQQNENTILIRNAGEFAHFSSPQTKGPEILSNVLGPVIGYYGAISEWFDIGLVERLARMHPEWSFVLVGNTFGCDTSRVAKLPNVIFTGEVPYTELPEYLHAFDVCMIPFLVNRLTLATNPVKAYEYMSAGKPVVSTRLPEVELMSDLVYLASNEDEFEKSIQIALSDRENAKLIQARKEFARENTWESRYYEIEKEICTRFYPKVSVVVVTYNNWPMTRICLDSLLRKTQYPNLEIVVVDNASGDETREKLADITDPRLKVVLMAKNTGFAGGNIEGCRTTTGDYIILLNNDTIVPQGWVQRLLRGFRQDEAVGMAGPVSNSVGNDQALDFFRGDAIQGADQQWLQEMYRLYKGGIRYTESLGFYCVAIRRDVYEKVGDLDTGFGIGMFEDDDYCERVRQAGYKLAVVEDAFVYHYGSASFKKLAGDRRNEMFEQNKGYFQSKWKKQWTPPKPPATMFHGILDSQGMARAVKHSHLPSVAFVADGDWRVDYCDWQRLAVAYAENHVVVVSIASYHGTGFTGTRKLGPNLYITNVMGFFSETEFGRVIYCGGPYIRLKARKASVDTSLYSEEAIRTLLSELPPSVDVLSTEEIRDFYDAGSVGVKRKDGYVHVTNV